MSKIELYDTTLRDGAQFEGISLSVEDKLAITRRLDQLGVHYVEGGWPGSNPKDADYFRRVGETELANAAVAAFGSTRYPGLSVQDDSNIRALLECGASVATLVGKSWDLHVTRVLETSLEENLAMISDSVAYLKANGRRVFFDAEHFFDGFKANAAYALQTVRAAAGAGAECVILCDTNGGTLPEEIGETVAAVGRETDVRLGIHTHNDADTAVAGALAAAQAGATHIQGTINGYGERCGNANLVSIIANLKLKLGVDCISDDQLQGLTEMSLYVAEVANMPPVHAQPFVGSSAFAHKGGLHASAVAKVEHSYQHIPPATVGNAKRVLISELSGRSNIRYKLDELEMGVELTPAQALRLLEEIKLKESRGYQYEGAEASFEMLVRRMLPDYEAPFTLMEYMTVVERHPGSDSEAGEPSSQAYRQGPGGRPGDAHGSRRQRPGERPGPRAAQSAAALLSEPRGGASHGLQGADSGPDRGHRGGYPRAHRLRRRSALLEHCRLLREHHRGQLDGPGGQPRVLAHYRRACRAAGGG